jgi:hypothetical protein
MVGMVGVMGRMLMGLMQCFTFDFWVLFFFIALGEMS